MRLGWVFAGVAATITGGLAVVAVRKARASSALPSGEVSPALPSETGEQLPESLSTALGGWILELEQEEVTPEVVSGAYLFADDLAKRGYPETASYLRSTIQMATERQQESGEEPAEGEGEQPEAQALWIEHYVGGWNAAPEPIQSIVREAFDHLGVDADGYIHARPTEVEAMQARELADELDRQDYGGLGDGLRSLVTDAQALPESEPEQ